MSDSPDIAILYQFKKRTEERLSDVEDRLSAEAASQAQIARDLLILRGDIARTQTVVLEIQAEMRAAMKLVLAKLDALKEPLPNGH